MKSGDSLDVLLSVTGENRSPGGYEPETIRVVTLGTLRRLDGVWVLEKGRRFDGAYRTPWGDLAMGIYTVQVSASFGTDQASLRLVYQVDIQGRFTAMHDLTLRLAPND